MAASSSSNTLERPRVPWLAERILELPERCDVLCRCPAVAMTFFQLLIASPEQLLPAEDPLQGSDDEVHRLVFHASLSREELCRHLVDTAMHTSIREAALDETSPSGSSDAVVAPATTVLEALVRCARLLFNEPHFLSACAVTGFCQQRNGENLRTLVEGAVPAKEEWIARAFHQSADSLEHMCNAILENGSEEALRPFGAKKDVILRILAHAELLSSNSKMLTGKGLQFCMSEVSTQTSSILGGILRLLTVGCGDANVSVSDVVEPLCILWLLDTCESVYPFPSRAATPRFFALLVRLVDLGLVFPLLVGDKKLFALTPCLRVGLVGTIPCPALRKQMVHMRSGPTSFRKTREEEEGTIITETNFRLFAYTQNRTLLRVLEQFSVRDTVVEGWLVCCHITRDSFVAAVRRGITADQVIAFLTLKAHPVMRQRAAQYRTEIVPQSIGDQLRMWEADCRRVVVQPDMVLLAHLSVAQQEIIRSEMAKKGFGLETIVYSSAGDGSMVVHSQVYDELLHALLTGGSP